MRRASRTTIRKADRRHRSSSPRRRCVVAPSLKRPYYTYHKGRSHQARSGSHTPCNMPGPCRPCRQALERRHEQLFGRLESAAQTKPRCQRRVKTNPLAVDRACPGSPSPTSSKCRFWTARDGHSGGTQPERYPAMPGGLALPTGHSVLARGDDVLACLDDLTRLRGTPWSSGSISR